ncbi:MAG: hypothetical protein K5622_03565 [Endomicrobiaceae bacterium]|nr:hypothetical protein [Endomicrobiaceae bacterium]
MKKFISVCCISLLFVFGFCLIGHTETVIMNDGKEYKGNIHHQDDNVVFIVCKEDIIKLNKSDIKEIKEDEKDKKKSGDLVIDDNADVVEKNNETIVQIGYDFYGEYLHKGHEKETDYLKGITVSAKYYHYFIDELGVGLGANLQSSRDLQYIPGKVCFVPAYISLKLRSIPTEPYKYGYVAGNLGYNFFFPVSEYDTYLNDERGGLFYSISLGIVYNNILFELTGAIHNGSAKIKSTNYKIDIEYKTYTFSVGYVF